MFIYFTSNKDFFKLPLNPEEIKVEIECSNEQVDILGTGQVNILNKPNLIPIEIATFFPEKDNPQKYIDFFESAQKEMKPIKITFKEMNINMWVSVETFNYTIRSGEEGDRYYELKLLEYKDIKPTFVQDVPKPPEEDKKEEAPPPPPPPPKEPQKGDIVKFLGGNHYRSSDANKPTGKPRTVGNATLTIINLGSKHPYHLIGVQGGSDVYGWVDTGSFETV